MLVSGVLSGSPCLHQAFFTERYVQEHPEAHEQIEKLKDLIAWQVNVHQQPHRAAGEGEKGECMPGHLGSLSTGSCGHQPECT